MRFARSYQKGTSQDPEYLSLEMGGDIDAFEDRLIAMLTQSGS
jgi:hypothetical protein